MGKVVFVSSAQPISYQPTIIRIFRKLCPRDMVHRIRSWGKL